MRRFLLLFTFLTGSLLWSQGERGGFNGTVTDSSGSVVPGATVKATDVATNVDTTAITTEAGVYRLPYMATGTYRITAVKPGFQTVVRDNVVVQEGPAFAQTIDAVSAKLSTQALRLMNAAVTLDQQSPMAVAQQFLGANGLG